MAVTKSQLAQWSREYEKKYPEKKNAEATRTAASNTNTAQHKAEKVTKAQLAQWSAEFDAGQVAKQEQEKNALRSKAFDEYRAGNNLGFADEMDSQSDWLNQQDIGTKDIYKDVNRWKDTGDNRNLSEAVKRIDGTHGAYTDADLIKNSNWTQADIDRARAINQQYETLPLAYRAGRRLGNSAKSLGANIAGAGAMAVGALPQAMVDSPEEQMIRRIQSGRYTDEQLEKAGYDTKLIQRAHERIDAGDTFDKAIKEDKTTTEEAQPWGQRTSYENPLEGVYKWGKESHQKGEEWLTDAQAGESGAQRFLHSAAMSAGENLALGAVNPALVLPVLSLQGAGDSLAASDAKGESPEKAMAKAALKFGAGWAINSVGAADLARTMGSDYAKNTVAGTIADWVRGMAGDSAFAQQYPAIANAVTGGIDNAMQAFVESYTDQAIDAAMGDTEAAQQMFTQENFLAALESGLSGGVSGAMGGAAGTGVGVAKAKAKQTVVNAVDARARAAQEAAAEKAGADSGLALSGASRQLPQSGSPWQDGKAVLDATATTAASGGSREELLGQRPAGGEQSEADAGSRNPEQGPTMQKSAGSATEGSGIKYSIQTDDDGKQYVQIDDDLLKNVPEADWKNTVRDAIRDLYPNGFERDGQTISNTREGRGEFTHSKYTRGLERTDLGTYTDKMRMASNLDEVVSTSGPVENEQANHKNAESFNRGNINIRIGTKDYNADVLTAMKQDGREVFYDVVNIQPTTIKAPTETAGAEASGNRSMGADEVSRRTDAESAVPDGRGQPGISETSIAPEKAGVNEKGVEKAGETVERDYADVDLKVDPEGLDAADWNRNEQKAAARELVNRAKMSTKAAQAVVDAMPRGVGAAVYAQAANSLYRMGVMQDVTFEKALELTGSGSLGGATGQVLALGEIGENALRIAYTYGKGEAEAYNAKKVSEISSGGGVVNKDAGAYYVGDTVRSGQSADDAFIELGAKSSGTAVHRMMEGLKSGAKGFLQTAAGRIYLSGEAGSETMMHETFHALNEWSPETGQAVMDRLMKYLVEANGMESTEKLVQSYLDKYAASGQKVTYNQALEEVTADAMETVFGDAESFRDFVRQQAAEAKMNAKARGTIGKVMEKIENLLQTVLKDVEHFLKKEPTNAAAKAAKSLTEEQLRDLRELYFEHQAEAGTKYREAIAENKTAPSETKEAAVKYSINPDYAQDIENWNKDGRPDGERFVLGRTGDTLQKLGAHENDIYMNSAKINLILKQHPEMTLDEIKRIPEILENPVMVLTSQNKGRTKQNTRLVMFGNVKAQDGRPVMCVLDLRPVENHIVLNDMQKVTSSYTKDVNPEQFVKNSSVLYVSENKNETTAFLRTLGFKMPSELQHYGLIGSITYEAQEIKLEGVPFAELENTDTKRTAAWLGSTGLQLPVPPTMYGSMGGLTYFEGSVKMIEPGSRNAKLAEFLTRDADGKYQLDVDADAVEAAKTGLGNVAEQTETIRKAVEAGGNKRVSDEGLENIAKAVKSDTKSRINTETLTERLRGLSEYLAGSKNVNWDDAHAFMLDIAEQIMLKSSSKNDTLWKQHPELHEMGMKVEKGSTAFQELVYRYGSWANAKRELGRHGVKITQLPEGQHSRWDADFRELQELGAGLFPDEVPNSAADALEAMANAHNAIKPVLENAFDEDWEGAKQDIALQLWQRYLASPELANAESTKLREELSQQWTEMRQQAKQEAAQARAKAQLRLANKKGKDAQWASRELAKRTEQEKARRDAQIDKVRAAREADDTRRSIRRLTTQITQSLTKDKAGKNVPEYLVDKVRSVAVIANEVIGNDKALAKLGGKLKDEMGNMQRGLEKQMSMSDRAGMEWQNSGIDEMVADWLSDVDDSRKAALSRVNKEIERAQKRLDALQQSAEKTGKDYSGDEADMKAYLAHLKMQRMEYENGGMARMTIDQLRGLREILEQTVYLVQNENKLLGEAERADLDTFATGMQSELRSAKGLNFAKGLLGTLSQKTAGYKLNTMGIQRQFERMGGYQHGGYMEKAGQMLNQGQYKRTKLLVEGTRFFDNVTGEKNLKNMDRFTHELVDIGLKTDDGRAWKITREQAVALYFQAQNMQGLHHMTHGGLKILNMEHAVKGDMERALHDAQTIRIGDLKFDDEGHILNKENVPANEAEVLQLMGGQRTTLLAELEKVLFEGDMADYCKAWIDDYKEYGKFTKQHINETSMVLNGRAKAQVENYIPLRVDEDTRQTENTGIQYDNSVGSEGFLKSRVNSSKPIWLDGIGNVVNTSLENVAQYAGMAIPLRNMQKLLNTQIGGKNINAEIRMAWGTEGGKYMEKALADLYPQKGKAADYGDGAMAKLRSVAAGAVLTANLNVTLLQAASLPTAAAELGFGSTGHAAVQFAKNVDPVNKLLSAVGLTENSLKKVEAEIMEHGDALLQYRLRGTQNGELGTMGEVKHLLGKAHDAALGGNILTRGGVKFLDAIAGSITKMDEITIAALWEGAKDYVVKNPAEFDADAQQKGSAAYWDAVNRQFQRTVERTQPNYTPMQRTGMQRSSNQALKFLMMYSTQRQQNCQIVVAAAEDRAAQARRYSEHRTAENKAALETADTRRVRAITSQVAAAGVISAMGIFVKYLLHRRKDLEDENGDITLKSLGTRFLWGMAESLASNSVGGSEIWSAVSVVKNGSDYDALSVSGLSNLNDFIAQVSSQMKRIRKDTSEMDEAELKQYTDSVKRGYLDIVGSALSLQGVPYTNVMKIVDAAGAYWDDWVNEGTLLTTSDTPSSATGQYDRLFNAIQNGDAEEVQGATKKLAQMLKEGKIKEDKTESQLKTRLKKYDADILAAAEAKNAGKLEARKDAKQEVFDRLCEAYSVKKQGEKGATKEDAAQRDWFITLIDKAVDEKAEELLKGGTSGSVYDRVKDALDGGTANDVQSEIDRLLTAGKESSNIKTEITKAVREEYLAGSDRDREKLAEMLLKLKAGDTELYKETDFDKWVDDDEKKQEAAAGAVDEWADVR